jgi:hypothetical protein
LKPDSYNLPVSLIGILGARERGSEKSVLRGWIREMGGEVRQKQRGRIMIADCGIYSVYKQYIEASIPHLLHYTQRRTFHIYSEQMMNNFYVYVYSP